MPESSSLIGAAEERRYSEDAELDTIQLRESRRTMEFCNNRLFRRLTLPSQCPLVYSDNYNISIFGLERFHPFDSKKWGNVHRYLLESGRLSIDAHVEPLEPTLDDLRVVHSQAYLRSLRLSFELARILEVALIAFIPHCFTNARILCPMRLQTGGTIAAARLALDHGWALNIGGGFHHASATRGGGFCVYADITLALKFLFHAGLIRRAMIVDLDAHQGNGHERDFKGDENVYIFDMFNASIYPKDFAAREAINRAVPLTSGTTRSEYLCRLKKELELALEEFPDPNILVYNAGTDCLRGDPLGQLDLSSGAIIERDEFVFEAAQNRGISIVMLTSGGYTRHSARVIADSILNLNEKKFIRLT